MVAELLLYYCEVWKRFTRPIPTSRISHNETVFSFPFPPFLSFLTDENIIHFFGCPFILLPTFLWQQSLVIGVLGKKLKSQPGVYGENKIFISSMDSICQHDGTPWREVINFYYTFVGRSPVGNFWDRSTLESRIYFLYYLFKMAHIWSRRLSKATSNFINFLLDFSFRASSGI